MSTKPTHVNVLMLSDNAAIERVTPNNVRPSIFEHERNKSMWRVYSVYVIYW